MGINVGINGFGRIGRVVFRTCMENPDIQVTALNDPAINVEYITYLIKFDSTHGKFKGSVVNNQKEVIVNGMTIKVFNEELPENIPWESAEVRYVVEASGMFTSYDKASGHLCSKTVKRVVIAAPSADVPMIVLGVNHRRMTSDLTVVSGASSTLYCLAPIVKVLDDNFGLSEGFVTSIHAMTPSLKPLDGLCMRGRHWRDHRSIHQNIIPANTGACKALGKILPKTKDKLAGIAFRVPIVDVSALDITVRLTVNTSLQNIIKCVEQAGATNLKHIIKTSNEGAVSSDFIGDSFSCILDVESCIQLRPNFYKLICWYENEYSYANRIVNLIMMSEESFIKPMNPLKMAKLIKPKKQGIKIGKGDSREPSDDYTSSSSSRGLPRRGLSPDPSFISSKARKRTDVFKIWNEFSAAKPASTNPSKQNRTGVLRNLVSVTATPAVATLSPECLKKLNRDFSTSPDKAILATTDSPKIIQRSPERNEADEVKLKINKFPKEREKIAKQRKTSSPIQREKCDNIQMAAVLRDITLDPKTSSSHSLGINIEKECNVQKENCSNFGKVSSDGNLNRSEINQKIPIIGKFSGPSHKNEIQLDQNIVTEIETHPMRSLGPMVTNVPEHKKSLSNTESTASQSDVVDNTLAKTIDMFVDRLTHDDMFQELMDDNENEKKEGTPSAQSKESFLQFSKPENRLTEKFSGMSELVRFVDIPRKARKKCVKRTESCQTTRGLNSESNVKGSQSNTMYSECETGAITLDEAPIGKRSTLIVDMQQQYDGPDTEVECRSEDTLSEVEAYQPDQPQFVGSHCTISSPKKPQDIYDKVESTSLSGSDSSFYVNQRKSDVIHLTDLTRGTSLDDLVKLDKICRIMEISDELSDKLFSALPKAEATGMRDKWSFKELCEKIKFDEFCEAVFDK